MIILLLLSILTNILILSLHINTKIKLHHYVHEEDIDRMINLTIRAMNTGIDLNNIVTIAYKIFTEKIEGSIIVSNKEMQIKHRDTVYVFNVREGAIKKENNFPELSDTDLEILNLIYLQLNKQR
jgi:hypothetical protein